MTYKAICYGMEHEGEDHEIFLVVPQWVSAEEVMLAEMSGEGEYECCCECYSMEGATLIARLLNEEEMAGNA